MSYEDYVRIYPKNASLKGKVMISGFHGIGATGYWTVKYLVQKLPVKRCCIVDYEDSAPVSTLINGKISTPYEIFTYENLAIFKVDVPIQKDKELKFYRSFADKIIQKGVSEVFLVGGLDSTLKTDDTKYRIAATSAYRLRGIMAEAKPLEDEHIIVGPVAILLNYFEIRNFPAIALLAYASPERVDPRAASVAVEALAKYYGFEIDVTPLIKGAETLEAELAKESSQQEFRPPTNIYT
ncbi:MAG: proteasome assembly chaperone family protein [Nitrososphaeria archaeon]